VSTSVFAAGAAAVVAVMLLGLVLTRWRTRGVLAAPVSTRVEREPDFFDGAFSLADVTRRVREEAALAGRAAAEGRPIAHRLEDLPSRRWIEERIEERISEMRRDHVGRLATIDEQMRRLGREAEDGGPRCDALRARVDELAKLHRAERAKSRNEQDQAVERRLNAARDELRAAEDQRRAAELRRDELSVQLERLPAQTDAEIAYLREACETLVLEHDMAYEAAEHRHPDKEPMTAPAPALPPTPAMGIATINEVARREGLIAGRARGFGVGDTPYAELPSRRWIAERLGEHLAAAKALHAGEQRAIGEELAVVAEHILEADRAAQRAKALIEALSDERTEAKAADGLADHERRVQSAQRALQAAQGRRHDHELMRERLSERKRRAESEHDARIDFLQQALAAAFAEHDLAFDTAAARAVAITPSNGAGPSPFSTTDRRHNR
jgi:hypothetical protein